MLGSPQCQAHEVRGGPGRRRCPCEDHGSISRGPRAPRPVQRLRDAPWPACVLCCLPWGQHLFRTSEQRSSPPSASIPSGATSMPPVSGTASTDDPWASYRHLSRSRASKVLPPGTTSSLIGASSLACSSSVRTRSLAGPPSSPASGATLGAFGRLHDICRHAASTAQDRPRPSR